MNNDRRTSRLLLPLLCFCTAGLAGCGLVRKSDAKLAAMLKEKGDGSKVQEAILMIGQEKRGQYTSVLAKLVLEDTRTIVRCAAARALGNLRAKSALPALTQALDESKEPVSLVRWDAAIALGEIGSPDGVEALALAGRYDPDSDVRAAAALALGKIATPEALGSLVETLRDSHVSVRHAAARALHRATGEPFSLHYDTWKLSLRKFMRDGRSAEAIDPPSAKNRASGMSSDSR